MNKEDKKEIDKNLLNKEFYRNEGRREVIKQLKNIIQDSKNIHSCMIEINTFIEDGK